MRGCAATLCHQPATPRYRCRERVSGKPPGGPRLSETRGPRSDPAFFFFAPSVLCFPFIDKADSPIDTRGNRRARSGAPFTLQPDDSFLAVAVMNAVILLLLSGRSKVNARCIDTRLLVFNPFRFCVEADSTSDLLTVLLC